MFGRDEKVSGTRLTAVQYIILGVFLILAYGLWWLQVVQSDFYSALAEKNKTREVPILAPRGKILDREGRVIVDNYPSFTALLLRDSTRDLSGDADMIAQGLHLDPKEVRERLQQVCRHAAVPADLSQGRHHAGRTGFHRVAPQRIARTGYHRGPSPAVPAQRVHGAPGGYVGEVSEQMLNQPRWELYNPGDVVGKSGVELEYNQILMGKNGSRQVLVNSKGKEMGELDQKPAVPGKQLKLTIDIDLQIAAEQALRERTEPLSPWTPAPAKSWPWSAVRLTIPMISRCEFPMISG